MKSSKRLINFEQIYTPSNYSLYPGVVRWQMVLCWTLATESVTKTNWTENIWKIVGWIGVFHFTVFKVLWSGHESLQILPSSLAHENAPVLVYGGHSTLLLKPVLEFASIHTFARMK